MSPTPFESSSTRPVLGQWKNFEFRMILDPSQYPEVLQHLHKNFFHSTPLTRGLECSQKYFEEFDKIYLTTLPQNLSFAAIDLDTKEVYFRYSPFHLLNLNLNSILYNRLQV